MKIKLLIMGLLSWAYASQAQETPVFLTKNEVLQKDFYHEALGTAGLLLRFEYLYTNPEERFKLQYPTVTLNQEGINVYSEQKEILAIQANVWAEAEIFIPYRKVNLLKGVQEGIVLSVKLGEWWTYNQTISFEQPRRFKVDIQLRNGAVKEGLLPYDAAGPAQEWLPDPYFVFTTNGGIQPLFQSEVTFNQYALPVPAISIYVLEGEQLQWSFYDRDGEEDQLLGTYNAFPQEGTVYEDYYGIMFGAIKNLDFTYARKAQVLQAINVYSDPTYEYKGKKGVALTVKYDLPEAFIGQQAQPAFEFYDKNGIRLDVPVAYPLNGTAPLDKDRILKRRGTLQYFIPFYVWKSACHSISFSFLREKQERIQAARHFLHQVIEFEDWVIDGDLAVKQNVTFQGVKGVELKVSYELLEVYENAPLYVKFSRPDGTDLPFNIYGMKNRDYGVVVSKEHKINRPRIADEFNYFVPYNVLDNEIIAVRAELLPDITMTVFEKFTPVLNGKGQGNPVSLRLAKVEQRFRSDNYGQVVALKMNVPTLYHKSSQLHLELKEQGKKTKKILIEGAQEQTDNYYQLSNDSGNVYLILPHRVVKPGAQFTVKAQVMDKSRQRLLSEVVEWNWTAPKELFNTQIEVELIACKFDKKITKDTNLLQNFPWEYRVKVGNEVLIQEQLSQRFTRDKEQFSQRIQVNREDNIIIELRNTKTQRSKVLWKGDLSKWEQSDFKVTAEKKYPIKMLRVVAKVPEDYNSNNIKETTSTTDAGKL
ncbi:MAG: hypothetical protein ACRBFS_26715 [Aureispira sp.]